LKTITNWTGAGSLPVAESAGGVLATLVPWDNLIRGVVEPWPPPELTQKLYASDKWRGCSSADDASVRTQLGYYCDLQSLNSEEAVTWSFFGSLVYSTFELRSAVAWAILAKCGIPTSVGRQRSGFGAESHILKNQGRPEDPRSISGYSFKTPWSWERRSGTRTLPVRKGPTRTAHNSTCA
jgi:hypothetical protein